MLCATLDQMSAGGIRDHVGGGFHRYSVDRYWRIPHFEKMLYDNGQLASVYALAHELTGRDDFRRVAIEIGDFVLRELTDESGGFYAALDADSANAEGNSEEGNFYRWEKAEIKNAITADEYTLFAETYGFHRAPNFDEKYYVPQPARPLSEIAADRKLSEAALEERLAPIRHKLLAVRSKRQGAGNDTKNVTGDK